MASIDPDTFRAVLGRFATGVTILTARDEGGRDHGMTVSAFSSLSLQPPLVLACIERTTDMFTVIATAAHFGVSILGEGQEALSRRFAEDMPDRFEGTGFTRAENGVILIDDALAHMQCRVVSRHEAGDHVIIVGEVERADVSRGNPLLYYRGGYTQLEN